VNLASYQTTGSVSNASTNAASLASISGSFPAGTFDLGKITFTSGANNGLSQTIRQCVFGSPNVIALVGFFPSAPAIGDSFVLNYGCNKSFSDPNGCPKFANLARFRGFPFVPQPLVAA
jgi:hypothetical protein